MPRGFLVKRYNNPSSQSLVHRVRRYSDEDRSDSSSDHDIDFLQNPSRRESTASSLVINHDSDTNSPSPPLVGHKAEDEPLSLTTGNDTVSRCRSPNYPVSHSVLYFPVSRLDKSIPATPPRQKSVSTPPLTAPYPPKKRPATDPGIKNDKINYDRSTHPDVKPKPPKRAKVIRKLNFDEDKSSPVSGTFIRDLDSDDDMMMPSVKRGDIDPSLNLVVVTEEARAELAKIENRIGDYVCQLCKEHYPDAFGLAQHRCSRIVHVEYRCPECDKVFNCPANLASHRRWHKPRPTTNSGTKTPISPPRLLPNNNTKNSICDPKPENRGSDMNTRRESYNSDISDSESLRDSPSPGVSADVNESFYAATDTERYECETCGKKFALQQHLSEHIQTHSTYSDAHEKEENSRDMCGNASKRNTLRVSPISSDLEDLIDHNHSCPSCAASFSGHHELEKHMLIHHAADGITCKYCPCTFFSSAGLTRHVNKYHPSKSHQVILLQIPTVRPVTT